MSNVDPRHERGWQRFGFATMDFTPAQIHRGAGEVDMSIAFDRGLGEPLVAYAVIPPGTRGPAFGLHVHRSQALGRDVEEWHVILEGTGIERFTNGDSVEFNAGDLIAIYPGTGHSVEVTGDRPVKMLGILPELFETVDPDHPRWPETWEPRIRVLTTSEELNPTVAQCSDCDKRWERPTEDYGSNTLATWAADHACTRAATSVHVVTGERDGAGTASTKGLR